MKHLRHSMDSEKAISLAFKTQIHRFTAVLLLFMDYRWSLRDQYFKFSFSAKDPKTFLQKWIKKSIK
jgi:hypothetical protein